VRVWLQFWVCWVEARCDIGCEYREKKLLETEREQEDIEGVEYALETLTTWLFFGVGRRNGIEKAGVKGQIMGGVWAAWMESRMFLALRLIFAIPSFRTASLLFCDN
jgi:hypothetical protein